MIEWVLEAWKQLPTDVITRSFKVCALSKNLDGSEDDQIVCIKLGPCQNLKVKVGSHDPILVQLSFQIFCV